MEDTEPDDIGPLWIRRQVFEHSVGVPLLTSTSASQIDFSKLTAELLAANVSTDPKIPPAVTYDAWVAAAGLHARLDSSEDAGIIVEALETNAPDSFVRANDPSLLAPGRQVNYRQLFIPVPELLAFIKLHSAAIVSSRFRESVDAIWPESDVPASPTSSASASPPATAYSLNPNIARHSGSHLPSPASPPALAVPAPLSLSPASPRLQPSHIAASSSAGPSSSRLPSSPLNPTPTANQSTSPTPSPGAPGAPLSQTLAPPSSPAIDGLVRKKTPTHLGVMIKSQSAIIASVQHAFQRETRLVINNLKALLLVIAAAYGVVPDSGGQSDAILSESGIVMGGGGAIAAESGTLSRNNTQGKPRRAHSLGSGSEVLMSDDASKFSTRNLPVSRQMFEHLSFLLTTTCGPAGTYRPISWVVPQWRDWSNTATVALGDLADIVIHALVRIPLLREIEGSTDVAEIRDLDRKTILRHSIPTTNASVTDYPHAKEIRISNCTESHLYLMSAIGRVSLIACRDCTLFVGACVSVSLINCVNMRVHAIARVCRMTNCFDTHAYLCTNRFPQIVGENRGLMFAPYNASYNKEEANMWLAAVGVDPKENKWDKFYRPAYRSLSPNDRKDPDLTPAVASVLPPEQFLPFAVPVRAPRAISQGDPNDGSDRTASFNEKNERDATSRTLFSVPLPLPPAYEEQLRKKCAEISNIRREIRALEKRQAALVQGSQQMDIAVDDQEIGHKDVAMSDGSSNIASKTTEDANQSPNSSMRKGVVQSLVQERFREWLNNSGRIKQINDLVRLDQDT